MRTIDLSKFQTEPGIAGIFNTMRGIFSYGWYWQQSRKNQEELVEILEKVLGSDCVLLRDVNIPHVGRPIPVVLITPANLMVINPKSQQGFFRAEGKRWEELGRNDEYKLASNNLIRETWLYQKTIEGYLKQHNFSIPADRGVMIFVSPETVVETIRPRVRVIQADGIKNFARELAISKPVFSDMDFRNAIKLLSNPRLPAKEKPTKKAPRVETSPVPDAVAKVDESLGRVTNRINFTRKEWTIVAGLIALVIIVLIILITLVIITV
ncbi:MAG: NERD domain-containing protein [Anaerolineales bacterium]|nr:NERD domain-containing protein [Anaerolineales bacterium]